MFASAFYWPLLLPQPQIALAPVPAAPGAGPVPELLH